MTRKRTVSVDPKELARARERRRVVGTGEGKFQSILVAVALVCTGLGWGLYLARWPIGFLFLGVAALALITALALQCFKAR